MATWDPPTFQDKQAMMWHLEDKVRSVLMLRGYHENATPTDKTPGFRISSTIPMNPMWGPWVQVEQIDAPGADLRPAVAEYKSALEEAGYDVVSTVPRFPNSPDYVKLQIPYPYNRGLAE